MSLEDSLAPCTHTADLEAAPSDVTLADFPVARWMRFLALLPGEHVHSGGLKRKVMYAVYTGFVIACQLLAVPYALYMRWLHPEEWNWFEGAFFTVLCIQAPLAWGFLYWYLRSEHFRQTMVPMMHMQGEVRRRQSPRKVRDPLSRPAWYRVNIVISVSVNLLYFIWLVHDVFPTPCFQPFSLVGRSLFYALPVTFFYRLMAPMVLCEVFSWIAALHIAKIMAFRAGHDGQQSGTRLFLDLKQNIRDRKRSEEVWLVGFLISVAMPCMSVLMYLLLCIRSLKFIVTVWFFPFFVLHFVVQALQTFLSAANITEMSACVRLEIVEKIILQEVTFEEQNFQVDAYINYLSTCYKGFQVLGTPITYKVVAQLGQVMAAASIPIAMKYVVHD
eukprot:TRINITY_DN51571_c0_g1_i1.p1 TRINITY_DN51571_c0_g1~~TRINITY_DN51571_c0_g1_i1.p1  ORF type:complete len:388 (-),score=54.91 TRINITY_DN51571_c0_g1_i1:215-1378(-)